MIGKITTIILFVNDVPGVAEFYRDILGFKITDKIDPEWTELDCGSCNIGLHKIGKTGNIKKETGVKIAFGVKDVAKAKALIESRGHKMGKIVTFGELNFCDGSDPEGNKFQISNRRMKN
ncbi:MAG TPA: VOC family protein [Ignavibacteria bacterium]|nr:VOC family protein [Ignavibacteria bacterium]